MAGTQELDTGQFLTYLFILILPFVIHSSILQVIHCNPKELKILQKAIIQGQPWAHPGTRRSWPRKKVKQYKKPSVSMVCEGAKTNKLRTHLLPLAMAAFRVGCRVESFLRRSGRLGRPITRFTAMAGEAGSRLNPHMIFDSNSFRIGVDNHASFCMANSPTCLRTCVSPNRGHRSRGLVRVCK
jgi:hypothetical protein